MARALAMILALLACSSLAAASRTLVRVGRRRIAPNRSL
jgi:hypothetical protein